MARGAEAKEKVIAKLKEAFGESFIGEIDRKVYLWSEEGGEPTQICISMTCPKNPIEVKTTTRPVSSGGGISFDAPMEQVVEVVGKNAPATEVSEEEIETLEAMMQRLGL